MIRAILFDKDGTLFDFHRTWAAVADRTLDLLARDAAERLRLAHAVGYEPEGRRFEAESPIVAGSIEDVARIWASIRTDLSPVAIETLANDTASDAVLSGALSPAVPDLPLCLDRLAARGCALGIATHDSEAAAVQQMREVGALDRFAFVAGYDSGYGLKPEPGMLLGFANAAGVPPASIVMVGDSPGDLLMASNAGAAKAVGVLTGPASKQALAPYADHIVPSIGELEQLLFPAC